MKIDDYFFFHMLCLWKILVLIFLNPNKYCIGKRLSHSFSLIIHPKLIKKNVIRSERKLILNYKGLMSILLFFISDMLINLE